MTFDEWWAQQVTAGYSDVRRVAESAWVFATKQAKGCGEADAMAWRSMEVVPMLRGWYGILDKDGEKRAALWTGTFWAHNAVEPLRAWCEFPEVPERFSGGSYCTAYRLILWRTNHE